MTTRPDPKALVGKDVQEVPMSCQRIMEASEKVDSIWIGPDESSGLSDEEREAYECAHIIMCHLAVQAPRAHKSGHPGGPLSAFTFTYWLGK